MQAYKVVMMGVMALSLLLVGGIAQASTYDSCLDAYESGENSGYYDLDDLDNAYCDMSTNGGGWLRITPDIARDELDGELDFEDGESDTDHGFDSSDRPYTRDDDDDHTAHYTFDLPYKVKQFFLMNYTARSNSAYGDSSDLYESRFEQTDWDEAHDQSVGDISFGFADDDGPVTSFAKELNDDVLVGHNQVIAWPEDEEVFETDDASDRFRIGWGDEGEPSEGWWPWWSGYIFVREDGSSNSSNDDIKIDVKDVDVESNNDVEFKVEVSGDPDDEDAKIKVEYEDDEGGNCNGDWEKADIKSGAKATNDDNDGEPSVDNGDTYQIGSDSGNRVIADGDDNDVTFTWDAEDDLGNDPDGEYCVRVTVRSDSGESDIDTYKVDFDNGSSSSDDIKVQIQDVDIESDNDVEFRIEVSGEPSDEDAKIKVEYEDDEGGNCSGDWEKAEIKNGATSTNDDSNGEPSVDNGDTYQIGSDSGHRVIADGDDNTIKFKWDSEDDLNNNPDGEYCVRVTVRSDSGESDTDTYKVDFGGGSGGDDLEITSPDDDDTVTDDTPTISGEGSKRGNFITVEGPDGERCNAVVNSAYRWSCSLYPALDDGKNKICATERDDDGDKIDKVCIDIDVDDDNPSQPSTGKLRITVPSNGATFSTNNVAIVGSGTPGNTVQVEAVGKSCNATVMYGGGWTCTLTLLPAGTYTVVATERSNYGAVAGTATTGFTVVGKQCPVFSQYHKMGESGGEIPQIQEFLRTQGYYHGAISGYFDYTTDQAIRSFQLEFRQLILDPWRLPNATGNWYKTTRKHANFLSGCYEKVYLEDIGITY